MNSVHLILSLVVLGVLSRDYDFTHMPPDDEEEEGMISMETHGHFIPIVQDLLEKALEMKLPDAINREYFCHLLQCYLRVMSRSVNTISPSFIQHFIQVCSLSISHLSGSAGSIGRCSSCLIAFSL